MDFFKKLKMQMKIEHKDSVTFLTFLIHNGIVTYQLYILCIFYIFCICIFCILCILHIYTFLL